MKDNYTENFWITETLKCGYKWEKKYGRKPFAERQLQLEKYNIYPCLLWGTGRVRICSWTRLPSPYTQCLSVPPPAWLPPIPLSHTWYAWWQCGICHNSFNLTAYKTVFPLKIVWILSRSHWCSVSRVSGFLETFFFYFVTVTNQVILTSF